VAWKMALENTSGPTALLLSRQNITDLPSAGKRSDDALRAQKGAYVVKECAGKPGLVLIGNGSEVSTLIEVAATLEAEKKLAVRVVSAISEALFREQPQAYQEAVVPFGVPVFGCTAGLPSTLAGLAGPLGRVYGMRRFGASAPYKVLDEKFGYTVKSQVAAIEAYLADYAVILGKLRRAAG